MEVLQNALHLAIRAGDHVHESILVPALWFPVFSGSSAGDLGVGVLCGVIFRVGILNRSSGLLNGK